MDWDKVFTAGWHTDSRGNKREWTKDDLDRIVTSFDPSFHEPPLVIGHPSDNAPAFGWIDGIKRVGNDLFVRYRDVAAEFKEWTDKKLFKKKSIAVYPDGSLRHVGYLGAMPPAIKGLPDFAFQDNGREAVFYDWEDMTVAGLFRRMREWIIGKFGQDEADRILPDYEITNLQTSAAMPDAEETVMGARPQFKEDSSMKAEEVQQMITDAIAVQSRQFAEQIKGLSENIKGLGTQFGELQTTLDADRQTGLKREFAEFLNTPEMQKRIPEGGREATISHLVTLTDAPAVEFGEGDLKRTVSAVEHYKESLRKLPEIVVFGEHATKERAGKTGATEQVKEQAIAEFMEKNEGTTYKQALLEVSRQKPELFA
jgi:hypothetical protein